MPVLEPESPEWWVARLYDQLQEQREEALFYNDYYTGNHPLPWLAAEARTEFRRLVRMTRSNYMGLVCDATAERASVEGFRFGTEGKADKDSWKIWQANNLDELSDLAWLESLIGGVSYFHVAPNDKDASKPHIWIEHACQAIVEHTPGTNRRESAAALKVWDDDWTGEVHATLFLPDRIYKYKSAKGTVTVKGKATLNWEEREVASEQPNGQRPNPMGEIPLIEIPNNPRLITGGISELSDLTDIQDRVNKTIFDRMQTQEFGVDPQKYASAFPKEDAEGKPQTVQFGRNRMITTDVAETRFGNFMVAPLAPLYEAKREDVKDIASRSRTPAQYLLGEMSNVNGETLKASESGLISKVKQRLRPWGGAAEMAMRKARSLAGLSDPGEDQMETIWTNPQYRTEGELTDAVIKRVAAKLSSIRQGREDLGYTQTQIEQLERDDEAEGKRDPLNALTSTLNQQAQGLPTTTGEAAPPMMGAPDTTTGAIGGAPGNP